MLSGVDNESSSLSLPCAFLNNLLYAERPKNIKNDERATPPIANKNLIAACFKDIVGEQYPGRAVKITAARIIIIVFIFIFLSIFI